VAQKVVERPVLEHDDDPVVDLLHYVRLLGLGAFVTYPNGTNVALSTVVSTDNGFDTPRPEAKTKIANQLLV